MKQETEVFADGSNCRTTGLVPEDEQAELTFTNGTFFITRVS